MIIGTMILKYTLQGIYTITSAIKGISYSIDFDIYYTRIRIGHYGLSNHVVGIYKHYIKVSNWFTLATPKMPYFCSTCIEETVNLGGLEFFYICSCGIIANSRTILFFKHKETRSCHY